MKVLLALLLVVSFSYTEYLTVWDKEHNEIIYQHVKTTEVEGNESIVHTKVYFDWPEGEAWSTKYDYHVIGDLKVNE